MTLQRNVPNPDGPGTIWVSPLRDVAHCTPQIMARCLNLVAAKLDEKLGSEAVDRFAGSIQVFIRLAADEDYEEFNAFETPQSAWERSGLAEHDPELFAVFAQTYTEVMLSVYFTSIREALHPGERPLGLKLLSTAPVRG